MRVILSIEHVERRETNGKVYYRTHAILDDGSEVIGFGKGFKVGDDVESFWDERWQVHKMRHKLDNH